MAARFCYGLRGERLIHITDLDPARERGLSCGCRCRDCGRPLQAHMGIKKSWYFQHYAEDASCSPQPMTLLHAFVQEAVASRKSLRIPTIQMTAQFEALGKRQEAQVVIPAKRFEIIEGLLEVPLKGLRPDVLLKIQGERDLLLEVRYSHAVDATKLKKLEDLQVDCVELDISDLPPSGISRQMLERVLNEPRRWKWLSSRQLRRQVHGIRQNFLWRNSIWIVERTPRSEAYPCSDVAPKKARAVAALLPWARAELTRLRQSRESEEERRSWLGQQTWKHRVAVACAALGLDPQNLPLNFLQDSSDYSDTGIPHHSFSWQVVVFMKFGIGGTEFSSIEAARWMARVLPDRVEHDTGVLSRNGFTRTAAALQLYFLDLEAQGLVYSDGQLELDEQLFSPRFKTSSEFRLFLESENTATHTVKHHLAIPPERA